MIKDLVEQEFEIIGSPRGFTRNKILFLRRKGELFTYKQFYHESFFNRERETYDIIEGLNLINLPERYSVGDDFILYGFLPSSEKVQAKQRLKDWSRVHNSTRSFDIKSQLVRDPLLIKGRLNRILRNLENFPGKYGSRAENYLKTLREGYSTIINPAEVCLVHNDLRGVNTIQQDNKAFYFDFEFSGVGHPFQDLVPAILENPEERDEYINAYLRNSPMLHTAINDLAPWVIFRACDVIGKMGGREIPLKRKEKIKQKLIRAMNHYC
mgnify:CR=1 FL=1|jgi:hypothetical protein